MQPNRNQKYIQATTTGPTNGPTAGLLGTKVRKMFRADRPRPYLVQWGSGEGRRTEAYYTANERNGRYRELLRELGTTRREVVMTRKDQNDWAAFRAATGGVSWVDVVAGWREHLASKGRVVSTLTVRQAAERFAATVDELREAGSLVAGTACQKKHKVRLFAAAFKDRLMCDVEPEEIAAWIDDHGHSSPGTYNAYRKHIRAFFEQFKKDVSPNPVDSVKTQGDGIDKVEVLSPEDTAKLFGYALTHCREAIGRLALEAFAGLRFGSAYRLTKADLNFEDKGIMLPRHAVKTKRRFYIDQLPENLWLWLRETTDACWAMENNQWMHLKSRLFAKANVPHPRNCLRHSFATYHVAAFKDPGRTAAILCHRNQQKLWGHYYGIASSAAGQRYFAITPENWRSVAEPTTPQAAA